MSRARRRLLEVMDMFIVLILVMFLLVYVSKLIKLYTVCSLIDVNYISIKPFSKKQRFEYFTNKC